MFPRDAPGVALLLLRFSVAVMLWFDEPPASAHLSRQWLLLGEILVTIALCVGFLTPPYSIDARLFGRQVFVVSSGKEPDAR